MLLSAALIARTLPSDSWWRKLLHFIFIVSRDHFPLTSIVYNHGTGCCVMKFKAGLSAPEISHSVYLYLHIFIWIMFSHSGQTGMMNVWLHSRGELEGVCSSLQDWSVLSQATTSFTRKTWRARSPTAEPLHHLRTLCRQIKFSESC